MKRNHIDLTIQCLLAHLSPLYSLRCVNHSDVSFKAQNLFPQRRLYHTAVKLQQCPTVDVFFVLNTFFNCYFYCYVVFFCVVSVLRTAH